MQQLMAYACKAANKPAAWEGKKGLGEAFAKDVIIIITDIDASPIEYDRLRRMYYILLIQSCISFQ